MEFKFLINYFLIPSSGKGTEAREFQMPTQNSKLDEALLHL
jgi:hypothetical protein